MKLTPEHEAQIATAASRIARESKCVCGATEFKSIAEFNRHQHSCAKARAARAAQPSNYPAMRFVAPKSKQAGA
jgi:hypothetical protein